MSNHNNQGEFSAFLAGFVIGGLVGGAVALILAPRSGAEIRSQLMERGDELRHRAQEYSGDYFTQTRNRVDELTNEARERVRIVLDDGLGGKKPPQSEGEDAPPETDDHS